METTMMFEVEGETFQLRVGISTGDDTDLVRVQCLPCAFQITAGVPFGGNVNFPVECEMRQPKIRMARSVISAHDSDSFIRNQILVDGDPITLDYAEFDLMFYLRYMQRFIHSESELVTFLNQSDASFGPNKWYQNSRDGWLHRLISDSKWNNVYLKAIYGCLHYSDGFTILESDDLKKTYKPLLRVFNIKFYFLQ